MMRVRRWIFLQQLGESQPIPALSLQALRETHQPDKPEWLRLVRLATQTITHGDFEKVVLARATDVQFNQPVNAIALMGRQPGAEFTLLPFLHGV